MVEVRRLYLDGVTVATEIARRLEIPASTTRRLLSQVKRELPADPAASGGSERAAAPTGARQEAERPLPLDGERSPNGDGPTRALVALTDQGVTR